MTRRPLLILGVDPGLSGALAWITPDTQRIVAIEDMPVTAAASGTGRSEISPAALSMLVTRDNLLSAVLERVSSRPGEGVSSAFKFGTGYGMIQGVLAAHGVPVRFVTPQVWKRAMGIPSGAPKDASRQRAMEAFPTQALLFSRKKDHGRADAALLALYISRHAG